METLHHLAIVLWNINEVLWMKPLKAKLTKEIAGNVFLCDVSVIIDNCGVCVCVWMYVCEPKDRSQRWTSEFAVQPRWRLCLSQGSENTSYS